MSIDLIHGDCLEKMKDIKDKSIDMILTDPPYGTTACAWDSVIPFEPMWTQLKRIIKDNGAIALFGSQPFTSALIMSNVKMFKYEWVWDKGRGVNFMNAGRQPLKYHENILVFSKGPHCYYPQKTELKNKDTLRESKFSPCVSRAGVYGKFQVTKDNGDIYKYPGSIISMTKKGKSNQFSKSESESHPTQKPVKLLEYLILTYTQKDELVLDFTMGSGSTGVACLETGRNFIGIELDDKYFAIATERIEKKQREPRLFY
jgi:site-specific DNA-methyltransferase (adenine-specific)